MLASLSTRIRSIAPLGIQIGYASGNLGKSILWSSFESFLLFYLVTIAGFSAWLAGAVLAAAMVWDGMADLCVAYLTDRHGRSDSLARLVLWGAPLGAAGFWLTFAPVTGNSWIAVVAAILLCRMGYTLCDIGHNTLLVRVATTEREASIVSGLRLIFSAAGGATVGIAAARLLAIADPAAQQQMFGRYAAVAGGIYMATLFGAIGVTRRLPGGERRSQDAAATGLFRALWGNRRFRLLLVIIALQASMLPAFNRALPFFGATVKGGPAWAGYALATITLAQSLSLPAWMLLSRRFGPALLLAGAHILAMASMGMMAAVAHTDLAQLALLLLGVAQAGMNMAIWALLALCVHAPQHRAARLEALPVGLFLAVLKFSSGLGNALLAWLVGASGGQEGAGFPPVAIAALALPAIGCWGILALLGRQWLEERPARAR